MSVLSLAAVSCSGGRDDASVFPFITEATSDTTSIYYKILSDFDDNDDAGTIAVLGQPEDVLKLSKYLVSCDIHDNVDGRRSADGLPDFAGETIASVMDFANAPYEGYLASGNDDYLTELTMKETLMSLSRKCYANPYDRALSVGKTPAKMVVLFSAFMAGYGCPELDTLFDAAGKNLPVIAPPQALVNCAARRYGEPSSVCVLASNGVIASGAYTSVFRSESLPETWRNVNYVELGIPENKSLKSCALDILDKYSSSGSGRPLSVVLVDDPILSASVDTLSAIVRSIVVSAGPSSESYRNLVTADFSFIGVYEAVAEECYRILRETDSFTHAVALPESEYYMIMPSPDLTMSPENLNDNGYYTDNFKYGRSPGSNLETYKMAALNLRYLSPELLQYVIQN